MEATMMSNVDEPSTKRAIKRDINNNITNNITNITHLSSQLETSTPLSTALRSQSRRHRPEGESPEKSLETTGDDGAAPSADAVAQQRMLTAYYSDLMWQSYYMTLASMMPAQGSGMPWRLPTATPPVQDMLAQQQQQLALLKWSGQVAAAMQSQRVSSRGLAAVPSSPRPPPQAAAATRAEDTASGDPHRTRIDMDVFRAELFAMTELYRTCMTIGDNNIERAASTYRTAATASPRSLAVHWEGCLQVQHPLSVTYSRKVFIGGVPWDIKDCEVEASLCEFGRFELVWPQNRERRNQLVQRGGSGQPRGYCYLVFEDERQVKSLLQRCISRDGATFVRLTNSRTSDKEAQVIPWCVSDASFATRGLHSTNAKTTVFVGALHGMITAANLATIMSDTFGEVVCAALDTDRFKYPIGSGRVVFANSDSYRKAVEANFLQVKTPKFVKTIQIDPYLEDSMCSVCFYAPGVYFCRSTKCFQYYCPPCWQSMHTTGDEERGNHKPLRRTFRNPIDRKYM